MSEVVYFIRNERTQAVKIGFASDLRSRFSAIKTSASDPVVIAAAIPGGAGTEKRLHDHFKELATQGEWFRDDPSLSSAIEAFAIAYDLADLIDAQLPEHLQESMRGVTWLRNLQKITGENDYQTAERCRVTQGRVRGIKNGRYKYLSHADTLRILAAYVGALSEAILQARVAGEPTHELQSRIEALRSTGRRLLRQEDKLHLYGQELSDVEHAFESLQSSLRQDRGEHRASVAHGAEGGPTDSGSASVHRDWLLVQSREARAG